MAQCVPLRDRAEINKDCWEPKAQKAEQPRKIPLTQDFQKGRTDLERPYMSRITSKISISSLMYLIELNAFY